MVTATVLLPEQLFSVNAYRYMRFSFSTPRAYEARYGNLNAAYGRPFATPECAVISAHPVARVEPIAAFDFGALIQTPEYGTWRIERDHNQNVKLRATDRIGPARCTTSGPMAGHVSRPKRPR
jgi:hypothetical protein